MWDYTDQGSALVSFSFKTIEIQIFWLSEHQTLNVGIFYCFNSSSHLYSDAAFVPPKGDEVKKISVLKLVLSKASRVVSEFQAVFQSYHLITDFHIKQMELKVAYKR